MSRLSPTEHDEFEDLAKPFRAAQAALKKIAREMRHGTEGAAAQDLADHIEVVLHDADVFCALALYDDGHSFENERKALELLQAGVSGCPQKMPPPLLIASPTMQGRA